MSKALRVDMSVGGSVIHKATFPDPLTLGAKFAIEYDLVIPSGTIAAIGAGASPSGHGPSFTSISAGGSSSDSAYTGQPSGGPLQWLSFDDTYGGTMPTNEIDIIEDLAVTVRYDADDTGGSGSSTDQWNVSWKAGGVVFDASPYPLFGGGPALGTFGNLDIWLGAYDGDTNAAIVYLITGFRLYDSTNTLVASSDWSSGDWTTDGWSVLFGAAGLSIIDYPPTPPPPAPSTRFFEGFPWRFVFSAVDVSDPDNPVVVETTSWADGLLTNRQIALALGTSTSIEADVWPDDIRVNEVWDDGYPRVAQTKRMVWAFRREGGTPPWVCRAAGMLMSPSDDGGPDVPLTHFVAYDPRTYLAARPAMASDGSLPSPEGGFLLVDTGDQIALAMLNNTIVNEGSVFIDAGVAYGGTSFYAGTIETTDMVAVTISAGQSVADIWDQLEQAGNCDLILTPIYDPINRPGYTHELSIYSLAGDDHPEVVMGWDVLNRCLNRVQRVHDGTPGAFFDKVQAYAGQGGVPVPTSGPLTNSAAVTAFGSWWLMQFFPAMLSSDPTAAAVLALAGQALQLAKQGRRTLTLELVTELAPRVFNAYNLGDRVNIHATNRLRAAIDGLQRVQAIPIDIPDDGVGEKIAALLTSPDYRGGS